MRRESLRVVAYDLRYASDHFPGIGTHAFHLFEALLALPGDESYAAIWNPALRNTRFDFTRVRASARVRWVETGSPPLALSTPIQTGRILRGLSPDVAFSPFYLAPLGSRCRRVLTLHDVMPLHEAGAVGASGRLLFRLAMVAAGRVDAVVTSSDASRREIAARTPIALHKLHRVRPGLAPRGAAASAVRPARAPEEPFALVVGINRPHKNLDTLARAWATFGPAPPLRLVGAGPTDPRYPDLATLAARHGASGVIGLGRVSEPELAWLYGNATLTLFPTRAEGFGFPLLEAQAQGCPAVAADLPVLHEIGAGAARFVAPLDVEGWADAVRALAGDEPGRRAMAATGRARAAEFTFERTARECLDVLRAVVAG